MLNNHFSIIANLSPELQLIQINQLQCLKLSHSVGTALIALQGAQLLQWQPTHAKQPVLWLSDIEPYQQGKAIRGGIPLCFPWFNNNGTPAHGFARISLWQLKQYDISKDKVRLVFQLFLEQQLQAEICFTFSDKCELEFINHAQANAQLALHSYFQVSHIQQTYIQGLGETCFNSLTQKQENVATPRQIEQNVDCIYPAQDICHNAIHDQGWQRTIQLEHHHASDMVLWNPWHKPTSAMNEQAYQSMLCLETARIHQPLAIGECVKLSISVENH
ncbi:D-hexose-6-phosphate mutarotase [Volucribacter amazonae]|uniref:Putative glucose-6-phosphate 1-epimerase n=1 Tax=Volucribacter amazonae TaxID=256731 RepID=A0A9X4PBS1_9PAST|nr:D-hexose-6-phosphate mutarotase [Volucribacter amazonae]MDG6894334.1 D-hexose-6-phosphate mutarotase [Volucribacter amazonae]